MTATSAQVEKHTSRLAKYLPIVGWLPGYNHANLRPDVIAAVTVASFSVPESMAYAGLAGLPPEAGLYAGVAAPIVYAIFGTSRQLGIGATSALSILVASSIGALAANDAGQYAALAALLALLVGAVSIIAWLLRLGFLVNFISESVLTGFSAGAALYIASTQLGKLFGIEGAGGEFFERISYIIRHLDETSGLTLAVGAAAIVILLLGERFAEKLPWSLIVVLLSILVISVTNLEERGVAITGDIPSGLPVPTVPNVELGDITALLPAAMAVFLLSYVEGMGAVQTFAKEHRYRADANQELLALGASNAASGLFQAFPVGGSMSRSAVSNGAGAKTPLASLGTGVLVAVVALFLTGLFHNLPEAVLGAVVIVAVKGLFKTPALRRLYQVSRVEFWIAMAALAGVLLFGMLEGVLIGAVISLLLLVYRASRPTTALLGRVPGSSTYSDLARHPENEVIPDVLLYRVDSGLFYANVPNVKENLEQLIDEQDAPPKLVIFDLSSSPSVDLAATDMFGEIYDELATRGIELRLANVDGPVRDMLRQAGMTARFGELGPDLTILEVVEVWRAEQAGARRSQTTS